MSPSQLGHSLINMEACNNTIHNESLSHLENKVIKQRRTHRKRATNQCNDAYGYIAQLEQNNAEFVPAMTDYISRVNEEDPWKDVKINAGHLTNALQEFKDKHEADGFCIKKAEAALRLAGKNMVKSLRRSERIKEIRAAKTELE